MFNKKGQAAATDALIFLSIVSVVFVMILTYGMNYGLNVMNNAEKLYTNNYHYAALKAFMSASYGRDANSLLDTNLPDSVATMIKEDYGANTLNSTSDKNYISLPTKKAMFKVLDALFLPQTQRSYMLLITHPSAQNQTSVPLIALFKTRVKNDDSSELKYYICYFKDMSKIEDYLQLHSLGLEIVQSPFILYKKILSPGQDGIQKEEGNIFLASWTTIPDNDSNFPNKFCENFTEKLG